MKARDDHWKKVVAVLKECMPDITANEIYQAQIAFIVCFTMIANEFAIDDPEDFAKFIERIKEIVNNDKKEKENEESISTSASNVDNGPTRVL